MNAERYEIASNQYPGVIHPTGFKNQCYFEKEFFPVFEYCLNDGVEKVRIRKTVAALHGENTTLILYKVVCAYEQFILELQPFVAARDFHSLAHANKAIRRDGEFQNDIFKVQPYDSMPELFIQIPGATFEHYSDWYHNFEYSVEKFRGLDYQEDLFTYGVFKIDLKSDDEVGVIISTKTPQRRNAFKLFEKEKNRREKLSKKSPEAISFLVEIGWSPVWFRQP